MDRSMLTEMHGKNEKEEAQNNAALIGIHHADWCYIRVTRTRRDFARLSLLLWFKWIIMVQCAKCSSCQYSRSLLLLTDVHSAPSKLCPFIYFLMDAVSYCYIQVFVVDRELDRKETNEQQQPTTQNPFFFKP